MTWLGTLFLRYPGYGMAEGMATEDTVDAAVHAAIRLATETLGTPADRLVFYGRSVGTGPAAAAAARLSAGEFGPPAALVLQSPFTSIQDFARDKAGLLAGEGCRLACIFFFHNCFS